METEKIFADGLMFKEPNEGAPEYVIGSLYINVAKFVEFLNANCTNAGGVNINIKRSMKGNVYCELNTWKPERPNLEPSDEPDPPRDDPEAEAPQDVPDFDPNDIPF